MTFGQQFREARLAADKGLKETAEMLDRGMTTVVRIEAGEAVSERTLGRAREVLKQLEKIGKNRLKVVNT